MVTKFPLYEQSIAYILRLTYLPLTPKSKHQSEIHDFIHKVVLPFTSKAGDHVKFGFPMAASTTLLAWGLLEYKDAYEQSGQLEYMYDCIRWPLEWMLKCHTGHNELYVQVIFQKHTQNA